MLDLADVQGQEQARLALEVVAAGGHNLLMTGPPGAGKSMLASRLPSILPPMEAQERLEVSMINSLSKSSVVKMVTNRPFRSPHHSASMVSLIGGGRQVRPGEISLAHNGVLFLDELPEFSRQTLDSLRQPIETGRVEIARASSHVSYPARFQLIAAMNPCRCGYANDPELSCHRLPHCMKDYLSRLSGPLLDRFDVQIEVPPIDVKDMISPKTGESSAEVLKRVIAARRKQYKRNKGTLNAYLEGEQLIEYTRPDMAGEALLNQAAEQSNLTARGFNRVLRVSRTLADLNGEDTISAIHIASALMWRNVSLR